MIFRLYRKIMEKGIKQRRIGMKLKPPVHKTRYRRFCILQMQVYLEYLSEQHSDDIIALVCDVAAWHTTAKLQVPENIRLLQIPPYTPEMNPIEQIWRELRSKGSEMRSFLR